MPTGSLRRKEHRISQDTGMEEKYCGKCDTWKPLEAYHKKKAAWDNLNACCKTCDNTKRRKRHRELYATEEGRERERARARKSDKKRQMNGKRNAYQSKRYKEDAAFRTLDNMRSRIKRCFSKNGAKKSAKTREIMGCTPEFLNAHLEKYFKEGMSWKNRGEWHIDHVVPCIAFGVTLEEQKILHWYDNLRPLWKDENLHKSGKFEKKDKIALIERYNKANSTKYLQACLKKYYHNNG